MPIPGERLRLLALLLAAPEEGSLEVLEDLASGQPWLQDALAELRGTSLEAWQAEHGRLFICGYPTPCLPFESAQRHGRMDGPAAEQLAGLYRRVGLEAEAMPPDYLGAMLECAAHLVESDPQGEARQILWRDHLLQWLPAYAATLAKESRLALYSTLGEQFGALCGGQHG